MTKKLTAAIVSLLFLMIFSAPKCGDEETDTDPIDPIVAEPFTEHVLITNFRGGTHAVSADIDGDFDLDIVATSYDDYEVAWWENDGTQNFSKHSLTTQYQGARVVYVVDMDGDQDNDLVVAAAISNKIAWFENAGINTFIEHIITDSFPGANYVNAADMDQDNDIDVIGATWDVNVSGSDYIAWFENDGNQNFSEQTISLDHDRNSCTYPCDLDSDGDMDILCAVYGDGAITWFQNDGSRNFTEHVVADFRQAHWVDAADLDGDLDMDIVGAGMNGRITWFENDGASGFTRRIISTTYGGAVSVMAADLNGDGTLDILGADESGGRISWWQNSGGSQFSGNQFSRQDISTMFADVIGIYAGDIDRDNDLDVLGVSFRGGNRISWWENKLNEQNVLASRPERALSIALLTVSYRTIKAAKANPFDSSRYE